MRRERLALEALGHAILDGVIPARAPWRPAAGPRLEVYRYGFGARTRRAVERAYPRTSAALGSRWLPLGARFAASAGAAVPNLNDIGGALPGFLARSGVAPPTVELACLEWLMVEVMREAPVPALGLAELSTFPVAAQPHLRLARLRFNTVEKLERPRARSRPAPAWARVSRGARGPVVRVMEPPERRFATALLDGQGLPRAVEVARLSEAALARLLAGWVTDGLFRARRR